MSHFREFQHTGETIKDVDLKGVNQRWQHPWHLIHRVALHDALKKTATSKEGAGKPAVLNTANRVESVDPAKGMMTLANGAVVEADLIVGADGIYVSNYTSTSTGQC
jgi:2-polyprenyl-6-methoxyphenol hydroxylase-like FAD-dependent oxidoreductase